MRQEIGHLVQDIDAGFLVRQRHMDVHPADEQSPCHPAKIPPQVVVAVAVAVALVLPVGKRVTGGRYGGKAELRGFFGHHGAQVSQVCARLVNARADGGADFDLAIEQLGRHPVAHPGLADVDERLGRGGERAGVVVGEKVFLLDPDGKIVGHAYAPRRAV
jgi:hypothetical protein